VSPRSQAARAADRHNRRDIASDVTGFATVVADALEEGRRTLFEGHLSELIRLAIAEYRRRFPRHAVFVAGPTRFVSEWVTRRGMKATELECLFCRQKLHEMKLGRGSAQEFSLWPQLWRVRVEGIADRHGEKCAVRFLAGLMEPVPLAVDRTPARRPRAPSRTGRGRGSVRGPSRSCARGRS
jgi:hypothetical protein